jgi:hypothetical protein
MIHRKSLIALAVFATLSTTTAIAIAAQADAGRPERPPLDKNGDGLIDRNESAGVPWLAENFDKLDKNGDGKLAKDELPKRDGHDDKPPQHPAPFAKLDTNKDERISRDEAKADARFAERFDKLDVNKDGFVDKSDFSAQAKQRRDAWFASADTDKDGKLSKAEYDAATDELHARFGEHAGGHSHPPKPEHK